MSGADFRDAVQLHPRFGGRRRLSGVLAPLGVFLYAPSPALLETWAAHDDRQKEKAQAAWKEHGVRTQSATQAGDMDAWLEHYRAAGFVVTYTPWEDVDAAGVPMLPDAAAAGPPTGSPTGPHAGPPVGST